MNRAGNRTRCRGVYCGRTLIHSAGNSRSPANTGGGNQSAATVNTPTPRAVASPVHSKIDACTLLTTDDLKVVQGEVYKDAQRSDRVDGDFIVAQCYFAMPTM